MKEERHLFDKVTFMNRWDRRKYSRNCDWTIIGISIWWQGPNKYCYKLCLFGFDLIIWINREFL